MNLFLIKNRFRTSVFFILICFLGSPLAQALKYEYRLNYDLRYGQHTYGKPNIATHRHAFQYAQFYQFDPKWSAVLGVYAEVEAAYAADPERYGNTEVAKKNSQTFLPRDNYLQYKSGGLKATLGYQQVVWGEAFGFYYADIVNPKDYRELGLGDLSRNRLTSPMLNLQWIQSNSSIQAVLIPAPTTSLLPSLGSDFNSISSLSGLGTTVFTLDTTPLNALTNPEYGLRLTHEISSYDLSVFYFSYYDRLPIFVIRSLQIPLTIQADYRPLQTAGATLTKDFEGFLLRSEFLFNTKRTFNTFENGSLGEASSNELIAVLGLDLPPFDRWQINLQASRSQIDDRKWLARKAYQDLLSTRVAYKIGKEAQIELTNSHYLSDESDLWQLLTNVPLSNLSEVQLGVDRFEGKENTEFGRYKQASRIWLGFKTAIKK